MVNFNPSRGMRKLFLERFFCFACFFKSLIRDRVILYYVRRVLRRIRDEGEAR